MSENPFTPDVVAAVMAHMNDDHRDDSLVIVRGLGGRPEATAAWMSGMDADGIDFAVTVPVGEDRPDGAGNGSGDEVSEEVTVRVPFAERLSERAQVRLEVVRMYGEACAALGIEPPSGEH